MLSFSDKLNKSIDANNSLLCVGLDPVLESLPEHIKNNQEAFFDFNKAIIDATFDLVCSFKPNSAFYEALGPDGLEQLRKTVKYINTHYPNIPVILDAKRADIGSTNKGYGWYAFDYLGADAITLHPYLGGEALQPFLQMPDKGMIILCRTSNPGAAEFQDLISDGMPLYEHVAKTVVQKWNANKNCLLVVGATYPDEMKRIRKIVGDDMVFLVPGIGAQGGDIAATMRSGLGGNKRGLIVSSSRDIIFASSGDDFASAARERAQDTQQQINMHR
jgi:orotidine-5'-phosphate decarboxylase